MRRITTLLAVATLTVLFATGGAAFAQSTVTSLPLPAGQGGPDNGVNPYQGGSAPGGADNPVVDAGPATASDNGSSLTPWLAVAGVLVVLVAGAAFVVRRAPERDRSGLGRRTTA